ncbi:dual specificity protein phosphatase 8-like [Microcaecilia unicolor]|uniref:Dual specificity protein phosphatase 8-like n=1 Tax=Microcaecilia unicolor TaxID=1415580 RepID=A0A6P7XKK4_9AMPH|nr:dual specificity protein phosphatase 8-like [Microcaecilia unicolor]
MGGERMPPLAIRAKQLAEMLWQDQGALLLLDCRSVTEYNLLHVVGSMNFGGSRHHRKLLLQELLPPSCQVSARGDVHSHTQLIPTFFAPLSCPLTHMSPYVQMQCQQGDSPRQKQVVVYDQGSEKRSASPVLTLVLEELQPCYSQISLLEGGFAEFSSWYPSLCEGCSASLLHASISQPCLSTSSVSITRVLLHLYLGSQSDALNQEVVGLNGITHVLNVSCSCPQPSFIPSNRFLRIPINDSYSDNILPWLKQATDFIDKAEVMNGKVLLHCFAGVSRSAAFAIAYVMYSTGLPLDEAYRFVKEKRPSISPNFNFLGQLLEYESVLSCAPSIKATSQSSHPDTLPPAWSDRGHHCFQMRPGCPSCDTTSSSVEVAEEARELEPLSLVDQFNSLEISLENRMKAQDMKRSFSLEVKSLYTPPAPSTLETPTDFSRSSHLCSDPKSRGVWNRLFGDGFSLFSFFSDNKGTQAEPEKQVGRSGTCKKSVTQGSTTGEQELKKAPQSFVLSRPNCKRLDLKRESSMEERLQRQRVSLVPV